MQSIFGTQKGFGLRKRAKLFSEGTYFKCVNGHDVDFSRDYLLPFAQKVAETIANKNPAWIIFVEDEPKQQSFR